MIPIFETVLADSEATVPYISPLNALVNDQLKAFMKFEETLGSGAVTSRYTGVLSEAQKRKIREGRKNIVFTNPENGTHEFSCLSPPMEAFFLQPQIHSS